ncbi:MAG: hypothetical protein LAP21_24000 [Acidobacteriia bacterium]|nr:hypothetical protein [Terriglobia bacterium]
MKRKPGKRKGGAKKKGGEDRAPVDEVALRFLERQHQKNKRLGLAQ